MDEVDIIQLGKASLKSVVALISRTFVLQIIQTAASLIILSVLIPSDVGIYVAVIAIQRVISFFTDFGLGAALIQKKDALTHNDLKTSFTLQAGVTLIIFLLIFLFREQISTYFKIGKSGEGLLVALVATIFISSFKTIPSILLERKIQFQKLIIPQIAESLVFNVLLIILILKGFRIDSYTYAFLASSLVGLPIYYYISPWKIGVGIDRTSLHHLKFGAQFQAKNILATIKDDLLTVILTKFLTFTEIGYIGFGQRIAFLAYRYVVDSVTKVTFSTYSRIQENKQILRKAIEKSLFFVASLMFPTLTGIILTGSYIIEYIPQWHSKWEPAVLSLIFFCLNAAVSSLSGILVNVLDATGRVKTTLSLMVIWTTATWILTPILIYTMGYNGVALASFLVTLTVTYTAVLVKQTVEFDFIKSIYKPVLCTLLMAAIVFIGTKTLVHDMLSLIIVIVIGAASYIICFYFISKNELFEIRNFLLKTNAK
jgi:O-antigen/teichoic acid export membrane protein